jgi:hypothetical protein
LRSAFSTQLIGERYVFRKKRISGRIVEGVVGAAVEENVRFRDPGLRRDFRRVERAEETVFLHQQQK